MPPRPSKRSISFDVLGTCFTFAPITRAIEQRLGPRLSKINISPTALTFQWIYAAQRDFTYLSLAGAYTPIANVLAQTLRRACAIVDLPADQAPSQEDIDIIMQAVRNLEPREGLKTAFDGLRELGWEVFAVTNGGAETSLGYFREAGIDMDAEHVLSCDSIQVAKPDERVYEVAKDYARSRGVVDVGGDGSHWFVAAHSWDLVAAKKAGFKTAYLSFEEHDPCTGLFGEFDVYARSMEELLEKMSDE